MTSPLPAEGFLGEVGDHLRNVCITGVAVCPLSPSTALVEGRDPSGHIVKWVTRSQIDELTETITFSSLTIKGHESYTGSDKTVITATKIATLTKGEPPVIELFEDWDGKIYTYEELREEMSQMADGKPEDLDCDFDEWLTNELLGGSVKRVSHRKSGT